MTRALDDQVAIAEADVGAHDALLFPALGQLLVELLVLGGEGGVMAVGEPVEHLGATVAEAVDVLLDLVSAFSCFVATPYPWTCIP